MFHISVEVAKYAFNLFIIIGEDFVTFRLQRDAEDQGESELAQLLRWAATSIGGQGEPNGKIDVEKYQDSVWASCQKCLDAAADLLKNARPRVIEVTLEHDEQGKFKEVQGASTTLQVDFKVGESAIDPKQRMPCMEQTRWSLIGGRLVVYALLSKQYRLSTRNVIVGEAFTITTNKPDHYH
ncbi:unnamed protein product [Clonostachys solani]|uniref:Uncharacterized protein n=1 Tax=Clonostachys solani TaxID=160281 RepID=A0A9N9ZDA1_9HYPO|nr:unnamed protein product [Clonostachys solani]